MLCLGGELVVPCCPKSTIAGLNIVYAGWSALTNFTLSMLKLRSYAIASF